MLLGSQVELFTVSVPLLFGDFWSWFRNLSVSLDQSLKMHRPTLCIRYLQFVSALWQGADIHPLAIVNIRFTFHELSAHCEHAYRETP